MGCGLHFPRPNISFIYHLYINIFMAQFVPVLLLALATFLALYLGFVAITEANERSTTGFASAVPITAQAKAGTYQPTLFPSPKKGDFIYLGSNFLINASEKKEILNFDGAVDSKTKDDSRIARDLITEPYSYDRVFVALKILNTNNAGTISVFINTKQVYKGTPKAGEHEFEIDKNILGVENSVRTETSGGFLFTSAFYEFNLRLYSAAGSHASYKFFVEDKSNRALEIGFTKNYGSMKILLNKKEIFYGKPEDYLSLPISGSMLSGEENTLELLPDPGASFKVDFVGIEKQ